MKSPLGALADRLGGLRNQMPVSYTGRAGRLTVPMAQRNDREAQLASMGAVGTLFSIVHRLSVDQSALTWRLWRKAASGKEADRVEVTRHAALDLLNKPNAFYTRQELIEATSQHLELTGECYMVIARHSAMPSIPFELWPVRPDRMTPVPDRDNYLLGYVYTGPDGEKVPLTLTDVIQIRLPNPLDPYRGMGPVQALLTDLDSIRYSAEWNRNFFLNSAEPGGIIEVDRRLSDDEFDEMTTRWREQHQGVAQAHRVAVLEQAKWVDRKFTMRDMQFAELRDVSREVVREAFGFPKFMLGLVDDVNRANAEASKAMYTEELIVPRAERWKGALNNDFLPLFGTTAAGLELDYDDPVPANSEADNAALAVKAAAAVQLDSIGFTPESIVEALDLPATLVWVKPPEPPAPVLPPASPGQDQQATGQFDLVERRILNMLQELGRSPRNAPTPPPPPGQQPPPQYLPPEQLPDISAARIALDVALVALIAEWVHIASQQKAHLVAAIEQIAAHGTLGDLAHLQVDSSNAAAALLTAMTGLSSTAAQHVVAEAAAQGVDLAAASTARAQLEQVANLTATLLADELKVAAARAAMRANSPTATPGEVGDAVQIALDGLSDANTQKQLGGALHGAVNTARINTLRAGPAGAVYAQEMNDKATCAPCREINGRWLANTDDLAALDLTYPAGAFGGYIGCLGGVNCRGTVVGVWRPDTVGGGA